MSSSVHFGSYIIDYDPDSSLHPDKPYLWTDTYDGDTYRLGYEELSEFGYDLLKLLGYGMSREIRRLHE